MKSLLPFPRPSKYRLIIWVILLVGAAWGGGVMNGVWTLEQWNNMRHPMLDQLLLPLTEYALLGALGVLGAAGAWRVYTHKTSLSQALPYALTLFATGVTAFVGKAYFDVLRPYIVMQATPLVSLSSIAGQASPAFPSAHAALACAVVVPLLRDRFGMGVLWLVGAVGVSFGRVYELVHWPQDVLVGAWIGLFWGWFFTHKPIQNQLQQYWTDHREFRRQTVHFMAGFLCVFFHWLGVLRWREILMLLIIGMLVSVYSKQANIPIISRAVRLFDRPGRDTFAGQGAFWMLLGFGLSIVLFPVKIAYAAMLILAVGDSVSHVLAAQIVRTRGYRAHVMPWNREKSLLGVAFGVISSTLAAQFFVGFWPAFGAATLALFAETVPLKLGQAYLDDNIVVPLVAGGALLLWL